MSRARSGPTSPCTRRSSPAGAPKLSGVVERSPGLKTGPDDHDIILRLDEPAPGYPTVSVFAWGGPPVHAGVTLCFLGPQADEVAEREAKSWRQWMNEHFPVAEPKRADGVAAHAP